MNFFAANATDWDELGDGIRRKIVGYTPSLMSVLVQFDQGAIGVPHAHDVHDQIAYVIAGSFDVVVDGRQRVLRPGDAFIAPRGCTHGVVAREPMSMLLDQFSPCRDDFLPPSV